MSEQPQHECFDADRSHYQELRPNVTRRQALKLLGIGLAAVGLSSQSQTAFAASSKVKAGKTTDIPLRGVKGYTLNGNYIIITQPSAGVFKAFSGTCTHKGARLSTMRGTNVVCNSHGATFDSTTGRVTGGPASRALTTYTTSVSGGFVYVTI